MPTISTLNATVGEAIPNIEMKMHEIERTFLKVSTFNLPKIGRFLPKIEFLFSLVMFEKLREIGNITKIYIMN